MASIKKRGKGYSVRWVDRNGSDRRFQCPNKKTAEEVRRQVENAMALGKDWSRHPDEVYIEDILKAYLSWQGRRLKANTIMSYTNGLAKFLYWIEQVHLGGKRAHSRHLSRELLASYHEWMEEQGLKSSSSRKRISQVENMWRWAAEDPKWSVPHPQGLRLMGAAADTVVAPTFEQVDQMIKHLPLAYTFPAILCRYTGLRIGQVLRLQWSDFDLAQAKLEIRPELGKSRAESRGRIMPISPHLASALMSKDWPKTAKGGLVAGHFEFLDRSKVRRAWEASGADPRLWKRRPFHSFRKAFRTFLEASGVSMRIVNFLIGHSDGHASARYVDPHFLDLEGAVALVPRLNTATTQRRERATLYITTTRVDGVQVSQNVMAKDPAQAARFAADLIDPYCETREVLNVTVRHRNETDTYRVDCVSGPMHISRLLGEPEVKSKG